MWKKKKKENKNIVSSEKDLVYKCLNLPDHRINPGHCERDSQGSSHRALNLLVRNSLEIYFNQTLEWFLWLGK